MEEKDALMLSDSVIEATRIANMVSIYFYSVFYTNTLGIERDGQRQRET